MNINILDFGQAIYFDLKKNKISGLKAKNQFGKNFDTNNLNSIDLIFES